MTRDAKIGALGADNIRTMYKEGKDEDAKKLAEDLYKANIAGINFGTGAVAKPLVSTAVSTVSTIAEAPLNGGRTLGKDLLVNTALEALGAGLTKIPFK